MLNNHQFYSHVAGSHDFKDTVGKTPVPSPNTGDEEGKNAISSELVDDSNKYLKEMYHQPGWDVQYDPPSVWDTSMEFHSNLELDRPSLKQFGHTQKT